MSNWTPKQALSGLMSKFRRSGSGGSSSYSSGSRDQGSGVRDQDSKLVADDLQAESEAWESDVPVSPLAMMNENSPEAWLGQFLVALELSTSRGTIEGAKRDPNLLSRLSEVRASAGEAQPMALLDADHASRLRADDW